MDASVSSKVVINGRDLADYCRRIRVSDELYELASELSDLFLGFEELASAMRSASIDIENLADKSFPFDVDRSW